jgi:MFS transporter, ACS family, DAL5 transporter family protein
MRQGRLCGKVNTSLGEWIEVTNTIANAVPSNHVPWIIIGICNASCMILLFCIRMLLARENKRRDVEPPDETFDDVYVVITDEDGSRSEVKVPKVRICTLRQVSPSRLMQLRGQEFLDLTDRQNRDFRYVL